MSTLEFNRLKARMETLEAAMERMVGVMDRIERMYETVESRHVAMMQEKSDAMRAGTLAEIRANMSVLKRELLADIKKQQLISKSGAPGSS